jgi:hypothetical protein
MNIDEIIEKVAHELTKCYCGDNPTLIFPLYRNGEMRVSEQESKILFSKFFFENNMSFAIEAPTSTTHGSSNKSGRADMNLYKPNGAVDWVIELKAKSCGDKEIRNDFEKMIKSKHNCIWFLTLKNEDAQTLPHLLEKIGASYKKVVSFLEGNIEWKINIVVLENGTLYQGDFILNGQSDLLLSKKEQYKEKKIYEFSKIIGSENSVFLEGNIKRRGKSLVFIPSINDKTFLHFSWNNESCAIRDYSNGYPKIYRNFQTSQIRQFIEKDREFIINTKEPPIDDIEYWYNRIIGLNKEKL